MRKWSENMARQESGEPIGAGKLAMNDVIDHDRTAAIEAIAMADAETPYAEWPCSRDHRRAEKVLIALESRGYTVTRMRE